MRPFQMNFTRLPIAAAVAATVLTLSSPSHSQTPAPTPPSTPVIPIQPPTAAPGSTAMPRTDTPGGSTQNGVAIPKGSIDPGMTRDAPQPGTFPMPVIPPPGTPGGNPAIVPK